MKNDTVVFEVDYAICLVETSYKYTLFSDGRFVKTEYCSDQIDVFTKDPNKCFEQEIIKSPQLSSTVKQIIEENEEALKLIPKKLSNHHILDGACETIKIGSLEFSGCNILTENMMQAKKWYEQNNHEVPDWVEDIIKFQKIFKKVEKVINWFVKVRLVGE